MTLKEYAQNHGISVQAVYQRIAKAGLRVADLKEPGGGALTEAGIQALEKLYGNKVEKKDVETQSTAIIQVENERLKAELEAVKSERDYLRKALEAALQTQATIASRLPAAQPAADQQQKQPAAGGIFGRIKAFFTNDKNKAE